MGGGQIAAMALMTPRSALANAVRVPTMQTDV